MKYLYSIIIFFISMNISIAQSNCKKDSLEIKHGLQFQVRTLSLSNFNGYTFAYRYLFDLHSGLRIGLYTNINDENLNETFTQDSTNYSSPRENKSYDLKFAIQYIKTILIQKEFSLILGGGPFVSYQKRESNSETITDNHTRESKNENNTLNYGLDIILGVEYSLSDNVILSGEYGVALSVGNLESKRIDNITYYKTGTNEEKKIIGDGTVYLVKGIGASLGLSIFF